VDLTPRRIVVSTVRALVGVDLVAQAATGCGSAGGPATSLATKTPEQAVESAVRSYTAAFLSGQGETAANMLSERCDTPAVREQIISASRTAPALYGQAAIVSIDPVVDGNDASVTYRFNQPAIDQEDQPWVEERGTWRYDKC
jgi:hypothetical protein